MRKILVTAIVIAVTGLAVFTQLAFDVYVWHQIEKQAMIADLVEGDQG